MAIRRRRTSEQQRCFLFVWILLSFPFLVVVAQADSNTVTDTDTTVTGITPTSNTTLDDCPLICLQDSICKSGDANYAGHPTNDQGDAVFLDMGDMTSIQDYYHCDCPEGFTGLTCNVVFESCETTDTDNTTDTHVCYHGGKCVRGALDAFDNLQYHCDCSNAKDSDDGTFYAGTYCEHAAVAVCNADKHTFCVNNGECAEALVDEQHQAAVQPPCECNDELFTGVHCEYSKSDTPMECPETCINGGACQIGIPHTSPHTVPTVPSQDNTSSYNMTYCLCPERYHGPQCEYDSQPCGDHHCYHGATCNADLTCNCAASAKAGTGFAGDYCQYEATDFCSNGKKFCVNGGKCVEDDNGNSECNCLQGWEGPACDIDTESTTPCSLECNNGGKCQRGVDDTLLHELGKQDEEHCNCPKGYMGSHCETSVQECGDDGDAEPEHICLHGSKCRREEGEGEGSENGEWSCDCETAFTPNHKYAGEFCQHHHTTTCTNNGISGIYEGPSNFAFCVNDGVCIEIVEYGESHEGCNCPEEYTGLHCELTKSFKSRTQQGQSATDAHSHVTLLFVLLFLSIVLVAVTSAVVYRMRSVRVEENIIVENAHLNASPIRGTMEEVGFEVNQAELYDVML